MGGGGGVGRQSDRAESEVVRRASEGSAAANNKSLGSRKCWRYSASSPFSAALVLGTARRQGFTQILLSTHAFRVLHAAVLRPPADACAGPSRSNLDASSTDTDTDSDGASKQQHLKQQRAAPPCCCCCSRRQKQERSADRSATSESTPRAGVLSRMGGGYTRSRPLTRR